MQYAGKGSYYRALTSAKKWSLEKGDMDVTVDWEWAPNSRAAFKAEYYKMQARDPFKCAPFAQ